MYILTYIHMHAPICTPTVGFDYWTLYTEWNLFLVHLYLVLHQLSINLLNQLERLCETQLLRLYRLFNRFV